MKRYRVLTRVSIACTLAALMVPALAPAQQSWTPGEYMIQAVGEMLDTSKVLQQKGNFGYAEGASMVGVLLQPSQKYTLTRRFQKGIAYAIVAGGDEDVKDLDLRILDASGKMVVSDTNVDRMAVIDWIPNATGEYQVQLDLYQATRDSFCAFTVLRQGGTKVDSDVALAAAIGFFKDCNSLVAVAAQQNAEVGFLAGETQAALFGMVLGPQEGLTVSGIVPQSGTAVFLARGHDTNIDIDLYVTRRGTEVGQDILDDAFPRFVGDFDGQASHEMKLQNQDSTQSTFVLGGVLTVR